ncbi:MAG: uL22 family ribosomal protein [archaeon]
MTNTERPTTIAEKKQQMPMKTPKSQSVPEAPKETQKPEPTKDTPKEQSPETKPEEDKTLTNEVTKAQDVKAEGPSDIKDTPKTPEPKGEAKVPKKPQTPKIKKDKATVNAISLHISTKKSMAICKFIKGKKIQDAISNLELVLAKKKHVPMKGEIPHRKGPGKTGSGSGRYPLKTTEHFIKLLRSLQANSDNNGIDEPIISEAVANMASRPFGRFGRVKRKRTHVKITAIEKKKIKKKKKSKKKVKKIKLKKEKK